MIPFLLVLVVFLASLLVAMSCSAWFTRRLEGICDLLGLAPSLLSLLGALGANIPNYVASIVAIAGGQVGVGLGVIIGSNIFNIAVILSVSVFAVPKKREIALSRKEARDARVVGVYALAIMLTTLLALWLLPGSAPEMGLSVSAPAVPLLFLVNALTLGLFVGLVAHALRRSHAHAAVEAAGAFTQTGDKKARMVVEAIVALAIALIAVVVMVNTGQMLTIDLHLPRVLAGLLVLAVATSLPNMVVAFNLARADRETACVEEIFSSNSINAALGVALPLLIWGGAAGDRLLLLLDGPLMAVLALIFLLSVLRGRINSLVGALLLLVYAAWVVAHVFV